MSKSASAAPHSRLIRRETMLARTGLKDTQHRALERGGDFPQRVRLGRRTVAWDEAEVDAWIQARLDQRDQDDEA